jgi:hypothetical protein
VRERTKRVIVFIGAGLSNAAGLPTWSELIDILISEINRRILQINDDREKDRLSSITDSINAKPDPWIKFRLIKMALGEATYNGIIRKSLLEGERCPIPEIYKYIWKLPLNGVLNLNLDRLATRAHGELFSGKALNEFCGRDANKHIHLLGDTTHFIANLHGITLNTDTWVLTDEELNNLLRNKGYQTFMSNCFGPFVVLFLGISADDIAVGGHLERLRNLKIDFGEHFWITEKATGSKISWAESVGIRIIQYVNSSGNHGEVNEAFEDLLSYIPHETTLPPPVHFHITNSQSKALPNPKEIITNNSEDIRQQLNNMLVRYYIKETN